MRTFQPLRPAVLALAAACPIVGQTSIDLRTQTKSVDFSSAAITKPVKVGLSLPGTCGVGELFFRTGVSGGNLYGCVAANMWAVQSGGGGDSLPPPPLTPEVLTSGEAGTQWRALGGDIQGAADAVKVTGLQGRALDSGVPAARQVLRWDAATNRWRATAESIGSVFGRTGDVTPQAGDYSFAEITGVAGVIQGGTGATSAAAARANLGAAAAVHTHALTDLTGVTGKHGGGTMLQSFGGGTVTAGDCAMFSASGSLVSAGAPCGIGSGGGGGGAATPNHSQSFSNATAVTVTHNVGTENVVAAVYDALNNLIEPDAVIVNGPNSITVTFTAAQSGRIVVNTSGGGGGGTSGLPVPSGYGLVARMSGGAVVTRWIEGTAGEIEVVNGDGANGNPTLRLPAMLNRSTSGNAATATALGANGTNCPPGQAATGVDESGNAEGCFTPAGTGGGTGTSGGGGEGGDSTVVSAGGLIGDGSSSNPVRLDPASQDTRLRVSTTLSSEWGTVAANACADRTLAAPGALTGDEVTIGWPHALLGAHPNLMASQAWVSAGNTVSLRLCNPTNSGIAVNVTGVMYTARVTKQL